MIKLSEYMSKPVITAKPTDSVRDAAKKMDSYNIGSLVVVKDRKPIGIITERDIVRKVIAKGKLADQPVSKFMTTKVQTVTEMASLIEIASIMKRHTMRRLVVVNRRGEISGIVTSKDLIDLLTT